MSLYGKKLKIDGVICGIVTRTTTNGIYHAVFEREFADIDKIESINWAEPNIEGECILPVGYGFDLIDIWYDSKTKSYTAVIKTSKQYLGDVEDFQAKLDDLRSQLTEKDQVIRDLQNENATQKDELEKTKVELEQANKTVSALNEKLEKSMTVEKSELA